MPLQNRLTPLGEIVADPGRGMLMGNRGILHDRGRRLGERRWRHPHWVCCRLAFRGRRRPVMAPGRYTELFFLDEASALAAGHRPCAECRRDDFRRFAAAWRGAFGAGADASAPAIDRTLHRARIEPGSPAARRASRRRCAICPMVPSFSLPTSRRRRFSSSAPGCCRGAPAGMVPPGRARPAAPGWS